VACISKSRSKRDDATPQHFQKAAFTLLALALLLETFDRWFYFRSFPGLLLDGFLELLLLRFHLVYFIVHPTPALRRFVVLTLPCVRQMLDS
jgi:hypothetical protein